MQRQIQSDEPAYRSGVAARLVGVPVATLRVWERRYSVVGPRLSAGRQRLYGPQDIKRLALIKQLVDRGHAIGAIAALDYPTLESMRQSTERLERASAGSSARAVPAGRRIALVGSLFLATTVAQSLGARGFDVCARYPDPAQAMAGLNGISVDLLILELATLREVDVSSVGALKGACSASRVLLFYRFASSAIVRRLRAAGYLVTRTTTDPADVEAWCRALLDVDAQPHSDGGGWTPALETEPLPPRFDEKALAALSVASRTIACECPAHLADLVLSLGSFERYSAQCSNESTAEAALHEDLRRSAGHARSIIEQALERVANFEGFELPPRTRAQ